ncbi:uncharacterized protein LOC141628191 [Silene latifolia]|uniref:uncharacterized protein LOC141628191 n=1 Tax=Silene latifolia TaxID=37657 RepID=UPI003D77D4C4
MTKDGDIPISTAETGSSTKIDVMSPFYLGNHDLPNLVITNIKLRHDNYDEWSRSIKKSLKSRRKFGFCDGSIKKPTNELLLEQWEVIHCTLVQWIMHTIDSSLRSSISDFDEAHLLWNDLADRFSAVDGSKIHGVKSDLHDCKQEKGMSVTSYFGKLKVLWDALANYEPPFSCKCGNCTCGISTDALARQDSERLHKFLLGLDRTIYSNLRSHILSLDVLPSVNRAFQLAVQEERLKCGSNFSEEPPEVAAFVVRHPPAATKPAASAPDWRALREQERQERRKLTCSHCTMPGHESVGCFIRLQKFPEWWGDRPRTLEEVRARQRANTGSGASTSSARANALMTNPHSCSTDRLSGMFSDWIIDTGASHHVTGDITWLTSTHSIPPCPITLPNGQCVLAKIAGTVYLNDKLILTNVLFVPSLTCNLLSVSQLVASTNYILSFTHNSCHIQDPSLRMRIGVGELRDGLYFFRVVGRKAEVHRVSVEASFDLWHKRLGHPSNKVVTLIPLVSKNSIIDAPCDICHHAKQVRSSFYLSNNKASDIFELIHCDLWGAYRTPSSCGAKYFLTIVDDYSRAVWVYLLFDKTEVTSMFKNFLAMVDTQFSKRVKTVRSDNGTEFNAIANFFTSNGITFQTSCVAITEGIQPPSFRVAITDPKWCQAMRDEILALEKNGCPLTRRSVSGWAVFIGNSPVSWKTKKQQTVSLSSAEAEYRSMAAVLCELKWLKGLLSCLGVSLPRSIQLFCDNQSALHIAQNPVYHERTKHIEVDCHFIRDAISDGLIATSHVDSRSQIADIFTKALGSNQFEFLLRKLGVLDLHAPV